MHEISQNLAIFTNPDTGNPWPRSDDRVDELKQEAYDHFWTTEVGQKLKARNVSIERFVEVFVQRFGDAHLHPNVPFVERLVEVGQDLLIEFPEATALPTPQPAVAPVAPAVPTPAQKISKEVAFFGHAYSHQINTKGCESVKAKAGFVTLESGGTAYVYPAAEAAALLEEADKFGLIH